MEGTSTTVEDADEAPNNMDNLVTPEEKSYLKKVLSEEEYGSLSEDVVKKIEDAVQESFEEFVTQKALLETFKLQHDEEVDKIQKELAEKNNELESLSSKLVTAKQEIDNLHKDVEDAVEKAKQCEESRKQMEYEWRNFKTQRDLAQDEKEALMQMVDRRNSELNQLKSELSDLKNQLQSAVKAKLVALENAEEVESLKISLQYKEKRLDQESNLLNSQIKALNEEISRQTNEILSLKRINSTRAATAEGEIAEKTEELRIAQELVASLKENNIKLNERLDDLLDKLKEQQTENDEMFTKFNQELQAQTKLTLLYKGLCGENESKTEKLVASINELQGLLKDATEKYGELETKQKELVLKHEEEMDKRKECISLLRKELKDANEFLEAAKQENLDAALANLSPCAAAASRLLKSGMTLTQIYTQYAAVSEELMVQKEENRKLELYVTTILNEIEEKAPILKQQRLDYEKAVSNVESLTKQMDEMIAESSILHRDCAEAKKSSTHLTRENQRLKKELADLGRQVCYLVKTVEEARGAMVTDLDGSHVSYDENNSSAQHVISKRLVTFSSIEDLQQNNQKLLALVRQLSAKLEETESVSVTDYDDLKVKEEKLQARIMDLIEEMDRQSKMLDLIKNQSQRYKMLYEQALGKPGHALDVEKERTTPTKGSPGLITSTPKPGQHGDQEDVSKLKELEAKVETLMKENTKLKEELRKVEVQLGEQAQTYRQEMNEVMMKSSKLVTQAEYHQEKCKVLETNIQLFKKQMAALEERNRSLGEINAKQEQSVVHLKDEALRLQTALSRLQVTADNLKEENFLLKSAEQRLLKEREAWHREKHSHSMLMSNLDAIKATFDRSEAEGKLRLEVQLGEALKECSALRNSLSEEKDRFKELVSSLERQTAAAKQRMQEEKELADKARGELDGVKAEVIKREETIEELKERIRQLDNEPAKSVIKTVTTNLDATTQRVRELEKRLNESQTEVESLRQLLQAAKQHGAQYAEMAETLEKQVAEAKEEEDMYRKLMTDKLDDTVKREEILKSKYEELEKKYRALTSNQKNSADELTAKLADSHTELESTSSELTQLRNQVESLREELATANKELLKLRAALDAAEAKYSEQVILHSTDLQTLTAAKAKLAEVVRTVETLQRERDDAVETLKAKTTAWDAKEHKAVEEVQELNKRLADLDDQNALLHNKLQSLGSQICILQSQVADGGDKPPEEGVAESTQLTPQSQDQLLKVVKFIRQEKDIAVARTEVFNAENARLKAQLNLATKKLEEAQEASRKSLESVDEATVKASTKHAELMRKVDTLNAVTDSNRILREERDKYKADLEAVKQEMARTQTRIKESTETQAKIQEKLDTLTGENQSLMLDAARWKQRATALAERTNKATTEDWRRLNNERENLAKQWQLEKNNNEKLEEELKKTRQEKATLTEQLAEVRKSLLNETNEVKRLTEEGNTCKQQLTRVLEELNAVKAQVAKLTATTNKLTEDATATEVLVADLKEKELKLKKIAKKYKTQFEELTKTVEEDKKKQEEARVKAEEEAAKNAAIVPEAREKLKEEVKAEVTARFAEAEAKLNERIRELEGRDEESATLRRDNESLKTSMNEKEERARQLLKTARSKMAQLQEQKNNLEEELGQTRSQLDHNKVESEMKVNAVKTSFESALEKERAEHQNQLKSLTQRVNQLQRLLEKQQGAKPSTSSMPADKTTMEPPTANIKPMAGSSTTARKQPQQQKQQTAQHSVAVGPCWRSSSNDTPFASIRPTVSLQTRTLAVLPTSQPSVSPSTSVMGVPQKQPVHTSTGTSAEALSLSPSSSHTDYMPATSTAPAIRQVVVAPVPLTGMEMEPSHAVEPDMTQQPGQQAQHTQTQQQTQTIAMVLPRERAELPSQPSVDQSCSVACSRANSSNTVTTTQAGLKRPRELEGHSSTGPEDEEPKGGPQTKRSRVVAVGSLSEVTPGPGAQVMIEVEYQVPTSSQQSQEDDMIIMVDSEEECNADEGDVQEFEVDNGEGYESYSHGVQEMQRGNFNEGPNIDDENVPDQDNNEVEVIEDSNEVPNQSGNSRDDGDISDNGASQSNHAAVPVASSVEPGLQAQQSSEVSSEQVVVSHAASSHSSFRSRPVPPLGRHQQSQLLLPQVYDEAGDDGIVPCTPTLYVPRRADDFGEAVSSPQVPHHVRFTFSDPTPPVSRSGVPPAAPEGLEEIVDDQGTGRSVPTTPLQVSPQEAQSEDSLNEVGPSGVDLEPVGGNIPDITVTAAEDDSHADLPNVASIESAGEEEEEEATEKSDLSGEEPEIIALDDDNDGVTSEGEKRPATVEEMEEGREAEASAPYEPSSLQHSPGRQPGPSNRTAKRGYPRRGMPRRPTPIVWNEPGSSSQTVGSAIPTVMRSVVPSRSLTPEQRMAQRGIGMARPRHRLWRWSPNQQ